MEELLRLRLLGQPLPPHLQRPEIGLDLSQLIMAMMARSPGDRPSYKEIIDSLNRYIKATSEAADALPQKVVRPASDPVPPPEAKQVSAALPKSRNLVFIVIGFLLLFILLAIWAGRFFYTWFQKNASDTEGTASFFGTTDRQMQGTSASAVKIYRMGRT